MDLDRRHQKRRFEHLFDRRYEPRFEVHLVTGDWSQSDSSRRTGDTEPWSSCGSSSPLLFGVALIRRNFHASPQRPARRRRPPPTPPAIGPMSMALSGEVDGEGGEGNGEGDSEVSSKELTYMK